MGWLIFNRPAAGNAMDARMLDDLESAWNELDADPAVRVIVNTGEGRSFQTGLDVVQLARDPAALRKQSGRTRRAELRMTAWHNGVSKPVIAAVNGICAGGGLHFVADADIVLASSNATFLDPHVSIGQVTAYEAIGLTRKIPFEAVMRMALVGRHERISAERALAAGHGEPGRRPARAPARGGAGAGREDRNELARPPWRPPSGPCGVRSRPGSPTPARPGRQSSCRMWGHPDQEEGPRAFAEKRAPVWQPLEPGVVAQPTAHSSDQPPEAP